MLFKLLRKYGLIESQAQGTNPHFIKVQKSPIERASIKKVCIPQE